MGRKSSLVLDEASEAMPRWLGELGVLPIVERAPRE